MTPPTEVRVTVAEVIARGTSRLQRAGVEHPRREAIDLWTAVSGEARAAILLEPDNHASPSPVQQYERAIARRASGEPGAYVRGRAAFRHRELRVDRSVLIPRPETEGLVDRVLAWARAADRWGAAADVGTGSGCIALSLATEGRFERIVATDVSREVLGVARRNVRAVAPDAAIELRRGGLTGPLETAAFDVLVSNPPYVAAIEFEDLDPGVSRFEPREALVSGEGGMWHIRELLATADRCLTAGGLLALEIDSQRARLAGEMAAGAGWVGARIERDVFGRDRYLLSWRREGAGD